MVSKRNVSIFLYQILTLFLVLANVSGKTQTPVISAQHVTVCAGNTVQLGATANSQVSQWLWIPGNYSTQSIIVSNSVSTQYTVFATSASGTGSAICNVYIKSPHLPSAEFSLGVYCNSDSLILPKHLPEFQPNGYYSSSNALSLDSLTGAIIPLKSGNGLFKVDYFSLVPGEGCPGQPAATQTIEIVQQPTLTLTIFKKTSPGDTVRISANGALSYQWLNKNVSCFNCSETSILPPVFENYCVIGENKSCRTTSCVLIDWTCRTNFSFNLPDAFSPNGDGINDQLCLMGWKYCVAAFNLSIYNRFGELIYETSDPSFCWDGTYKNHLLETEVVFFSLAYRDKELGEVHFKKGNITLVK